MIAAMYHLPSASNPIQYGRLEKQCTSAQKNCLPEIPDCPEYEKFFQERFRDTASLKGKDRFRLHLSEISLVQYKIVKHKQY